MAGTDSPARAASSVGTISHHDAPETLHGWGREQAFAFRRRELILARLIRYLQQTALTDLQLRSS